MAKCEWQLFDSILRICPRTRVRARSPARSPHQDKTRQAKGALTKNYLENSSNFWSQPKKKKKVKCPPVWVASAGAGSASGGQPKSDYGGEYERRGALHLDKQQHDTLDPCNVGHGAQTQSS